MRENVLYGRSCEVALSNLVRGWKACADCRNAERIMLKNLYPWLTGVACAGVVSLAGLSGVASQEVPAASKVGTTKTAEVSNAEVGKAAAKGAEGLSAQEVAERIQNFYQKTVD